MRGQVLGPASKPSVVTASGIGYVVACPDELEELAQVELWIHTATSRDGEVRLFGFKTPVQRQAFEALIAVNAVGPAAALAILKELSLSDLVQAILSKDAKAISQAKGVGAKAAASIIATITLPTELLDLGTSTSIDLGTVVVSSVDSDIIRSLQDLGMGLAEAKTAVAIAHEQVQGNDLSELLTAALIAGTANA